MKRLSEPPFSYSRENSLCKYLQHLTVNEALEAKNIGFD